MLVLPVTLTRSEACSDVEERRFSAALPRHYPARSYPNLTSTAASNFE